MKKIFLITFAIFLTCNLWAVDFSSEEPLKLDEVDLLAEGEKQMRDYTAPLEDKRLDYLSVYSTANGEKKGFWKKLVESKDVKPYKFMDDISFSGVPLVLAGIIAKSEKKSFRQNYDQTSSSKTRLMTNFHSEIDNYTQFVPFALSTVLNVAGYEGRSNFPRYAVSSAFSFGMMALIVNPLKSWTSEMRPDGSTANSWPSGHTATAFTAATILHKEYGMTRSPWFSVGAYAIATATGAMRVLNNRHWVSDVLSGAGIGIISTELGYAFADLIFKGKGLKRGDLQDHPNLITNPSFFSINMGIGFGTRNLDFGDGYAFKFRASTAVGVEGAYFLNPYIGIGGRLRVKTTPIGNFTEFVEDERASYEEVKDIAYWSSEEGQEPLNEIELTIESDHLTEFNAAAGVYFSYPFCERLALGTKLLVGTSMMNALEVGGHASGASLYTVDGKYEQDWDFLSIDANNTITYGTGLSLTYGYKSTFSFRLFFDYDFARKEYTMTYDPNYWLNFYAGQSVTHRMLGSEMDPRVSTVKKNMNSYIVGASFAISF